jgi:hypothetical protein
MTSAEQSFPLVDESFLCVDSASVQDPDLVLVTAHELP